MSSDNENLDILATRLASQFNYDSQVLFELYEKTQSNAFLVALLDVASRTADPPVALAIVNGYLQGDRGVILEPEALIDAYCKLFMPEEQKYLELKVEKTYFPISCTQPLKF